MIRQKQKTNKPRPKKEAPRKKRVEKPIGCVTMKCRLTHLINDISNRNEVKEILNKKGWKDITFKTDTLFSGKSGGIFFAEVMIE